MKRKFREWSSGNRRSELSGEADGFRVDLRPVCVCSAACRPPRLPRGCIRYLNKNKNQDGRDHSPTLTGLRNKTRLKHMTRVRKPIGPAPAPAPAYYLRFSVCTSPRGERSPAIQTADHAASASACAMARATSSSSSSSGSSYSSYSSCSSSSSWPLLPFVFVVKKASWYSAAETC